MEKGEVILKKRILVLKAGPQYELHGAFQKWVDGLSLKYEGDIVVFDARPTEIGSFQINSISSKGGSAARLFRYCIHVTKLCSKNHYDLIVTYDPLKTGIVGVLGSFVGKSKLIVEINGDYSNLANYSEIRNSFSRNLKRGFFLTVGRCVLQFADGIKLQYASMLEAYNVDTKDKTVSQYPNFVDVDRFENLCDEKVILMVGYPIHIKGVDILVDAFKTIADDFPDWKLKILGWFEHEMDELEQIIDHSQIIYQPPVNPSEMREHTGRCGIFVSASRTEGIARVLLEAMSAEKPIIASRVGGTPAVITNDVNGLLFESENIVELADKLKKLIKNTNLRKRLASAGKSRLSNEFSNECYFNNTDELYRRVLLK